MTLRKRLYVAPDLHRDLHILKSKLQCRSIDELLRALVTVGSHDRQDFLDVLRDAVSVVRR